MNEVEKMYENAGIKKAKDYYCPNCETKLVGEHKDYVCPNERCDYVLCEDDLDFQECLEHLSYREGYPPFTAEKQISIIKWLLESYDIGFSQLGQRIDTSLDGVNCIGGLGSGDTFEESLAQAINDLWQDLTAEERKQIKEVLE